MEEKRPEGSDDDEEDEVEWTDVKWLAADLVAGHDKEFLLEELFKKHGLGVGAVVTPTTHKSLLSFAATGDCVNVAKLLIQKGKARKDATDKFGKTPLDLAIAAGCSDAVLKVLRLEGDRIEITGATGDRTIQKKVGAVVVRFAV